ncbi:MAG: cytochrome c biogenesis protein CcdA [Thermoleophilia bacterium]|nr:cytochrome c biogenesis protein CcdA [Thermoleophilia bacterium]
MSLGDALAQQLGAGSFGPVQLTIAFAGGLLAGFGPCVLPMMPAVFGYVTGSVAQANAGAGGRAGYIQGLMLAGVFVLGMAAVFTGIGAIAGLLGRAVLISGWAIYVVSFILVVLGLHFLGAVQLPVERLNRRALRHTGRSDFLGALGLGVLFGLVASPCSTPVLAVIATMAAAGRSPAAGAFLLFVYGLGKGVPLLLIGLASGSMRAMRPLSRATPMFTKLGGVALIGVAAYLTVTA